MKKPTKAQLYNQIAQLEQLQTKMQQEMEREKRKRWEKLLPVAFAVCRKHLKSAFNNTFELLHFEHVDGSGYWFTFRLVNDKRLQTYAVRHYEVDEEIR